MIKLFSLLCALTTFALPTEIDYACMEQGATLFNYADGAYTAVADLPSTYFVAVIKDNEDGYSLVSYMDVSGYVETAKLNKVDFTPKYKYADVAFTVSNDSQPANLRSEPDSTQDNVLAVMPDKGTGKVIGSIQGNQLIAGATNTWYYVRYENEGGFTYGYVYGAHVKPVVFDKNSYEREETQTGGIENEQERPTVEMSLPVQVLIIGVLCLPVLFIMLMMFSSKKKRVPRHMDDDDSQT